MPNQQLANSQMSSCGGFMQWGCEIIGVKRVQVRAIFQVFFDSIQISGSRVIVNS
jgi:hypothetical protein